jgi:hypothetical protein
MEADPVSETLCFLVFEFKVMDKVQKSSNCDRLKVVENRVLRRVFEPKMDVATGR